MYKFQYNMDVMCHVSCITCPISNLQSSNPPSSNFAPSNSPHLPLPPSSSVNGINMFGNTALHFSKELSFAGVSRMLVRKGADLLLYNEMGKTAGDRVQD